MLSRSESFAFVKDWLTDAFEERKESAVSTRGVYDDYKGFCEHKAIEVMCPSAFGKLFKKVFPHITVRRLGPRGENFNHYYNLGRKGSSPASTPTPAALPDEIPPSSFTSLMARGSLAPPPALRGAAGMMGLPPLLPPPNGVVASHHLPPPHVGALGAGGYPPFGSFPPPSSFQPGATIGHQLQALHHLQSPPQQQYPPLQYPPPPQYLLHNPPPSFTQSPLLSLGSTGSLPSLSLDRRTAGLWNSSAHLDLMSRVSKYREWYLNECWAVQPINPAALEPDNLQHFISSDGPLVGRESLALSSFLAMSIAAFNHGDFEISREFFNRARSQLGYLFDETSIDIAFVLQPMSIVSHWWTGKDSSAYYHTLLSEMCGQLNALNSDLFVSSLQTHFLIKTYDVRDWKKKVDALNKYPRCPSYPEHWTYHESLLQRMRTQGGIWQATISQLLDILEFLTAYQRRRQDLDEARTYRRRDRDNNDARKRKRESSNRSDNSDEEERGSDSSSSSSEGGELAGEFQAGPEEREHTRQVLEGIGKRLANLNGQMEHVLQERDFNTMPRVATTLLKVWVMMVDVEYKTCLDCELADDRAEERGLKRPRANERTGDEDHDGEAPHNRQNGRTGENNGHSTTVKSEGGDDAAGEEADRADERPQPNHHHNGVKARQDGFADAMEEKSWAERACEDLVQLFATLDVPLRGVCMSMIHIFLRGPLLDILQRGRNVAAIRVLLDLVSPLSVVMSLSDIRHRLMELMPAL